MSWDWPVVTVLCIAAFFIVDRVCLHRERMNGVLDEEDSNTSG